MRTWSSRRRWTRPPATSGCTRTRWPWPEAATRRWWAATCTQCRFRLTRSQPRSCRDRRSCRWSSNDKNGFFYENESNSTFKTQLTTSQSRWKWNLFPLKKETEFKMKWRIDSDFLPWSLSFLQDFFIGRNWGIWGFSTVVNLKIF